MQHDTWVDSWLEQVAKSRSSGDKSVPYDAASTSGGSVSATQPTLFPLLPGPAPGLRDAIRAGWSLFQFAVVMTALLEARHIGRRHPDGRGWLLEDVSLEIHAGQRLAVGGPFGSGKTLLARALAMLDPLTAGEIRWRDRPVQRERVPSFRRNVVYLHQKPALWGETVEAVFGRPLVLKTHCGRRFQRGRIVDWLGQLGRDDSFLKKRVVDLSGGECQITALLRAIQLEPALLLLDEPTAALDAPTTLAVEQLLQRWFLEAPGNRAWLWIGHDQEQIRRVADRSLRMESGRLVDSR